MSTWFKDKNGKVIKVGGEIAINERCCCGEQDCCCVQFLGGPPHPDMRVTITGFLVGVTIIPEIGADCAEWGPTPISHDAVVCGGEITEGDIAILIFCDLLTGQMEITFDLVSTPVCEMSVTLVNRDCDFEGSGKFSGLWDYLISDQDGGPCPCDGETGQVLIEEI